ncbi:hypothetical protein SAGO17_00117 [Mimivirus AB-566-O17]|uniref:Uncharacterized protein n=1 Tax=Mimivirus AB-566-O17 TaxID=1988039 RepID=A0A1X9VNW9_9VIRU|nr:hypothetical protein SAGO17_00117 [Mimivirus AB-566-O17]
MSMIIGKTIEYAKTHEWESYNGELLVYSFIKTSDGMIFYIKIEGEENEGDVLDYQQISKEDYLNLIKEYSFKE